MGEGLKSPSESGSSTADICTKLSQGRFFCRLFGAVSTGGEHWRISSAISGVNLDIGSKHNIPLRTAHQRRPYHFRTHGPWISGCFACSKCVIGPPALYGGERCITHKRDKPVGYESQANDARISPDCRCFCQGPSKTSFSTFSFRPATFTPRQ